MSVKKLHLQGLRALAITGVVLFHFFPSYFPNGYLGVDQFFLLSGYLMTMMLNKTPNVSLVVLQDFWYRRVKRIVPLYYLVSLFILGSVFLLPTSAMGTNYRSGVHAITFLTNIIRPTDNSDYAEKLGLAVDQFTHTWSLCVEMQFYLLFPLLFVGINCWNTKHQPYFMIILAVLSLYFQAVSDSFLSFNSVLSRMWQFIAGTFVYKMIEEKDKSYEKEDVFLCETLLPIETIQTRESKFVLSLAIYVLFFILLIPIELDPTLLKINVIVLTAIVVRCSEGIWILENRLMVFIGEVSYSWYLVHWPVVVIFKIHKASTKQEMLFGMSVSLFISVLIHFAYEKQYLRWQKSTASGVSFFLFLGNIGLLLFIGNNFSVNNVAIIHQRINTTSVISSRFIWDSDYINEMPMGYENKTNEERLQLMYAYDGNDLRQLTSFPCQKIPSEWADERRCKMSNNGSTAHNLHSLLVIGNSYAANVMPIIFDECKDVFQNHYLSWIGSCEPLMNTDLSGTRWNCLSDKCFLNMTKEINPDVLFIVVRHFDMMKIKNGTSPMNDLNFKTAVQRLQDLEPFVKRRIYILDAIPQLIYSTLSTKLKQSMSNATNFNDEELFDKHADYIIARERLSRLVSGCSKCRLFDYMPQFYINGKFKVYDPKYYVPFFTVGLHLASPGLEKVRPLYRHLCHNV